MMTAGKRLRQFLTEEIPLQIVGAINPYCALMAEKIGYKALYLSGSGVAAASHGLPDLGITTLQDVIEDANRITSRTSLPLLVDIDTGFGGTFNIARTIKELTRIGVAAVHIEDQVAEKRCGHRPGKAIVAINEMVDRIKSAVDAKTDAEFVIMARTDAAANEGLNSAIERACAYLEAGADMIFPEALLSLDEYQTFSAAVKAPILANITEFGKTPLFTKEELAAVGITMILYPLSAFRAMNEAALQVYKAIRQEGTQNNVLPIMQTREELYKFLDYYTYEKKLDDLFGKRL